VVFFEGDAFIQMGDLLLIAGEYFLCLWDTIARDCNYHMKYVDYHVGEAWFLSNHSVSLIHWLVKESFTTYKNTISLFLGNDLDQLLKRKVTPRTICTTVVYDDDSNSFVATKKTDFQSLLVFPNVWTLYAYLQPWVDTKKIGIVTSTHTEKQKNELFWWLKQWSVATLACTYAGIFQDRKNLGHICIVDPHAWYYKNRQDPRYDAVTVCHQLSHWHDAEVVFL
jgi:primosomal protein N'